MVGFDRITHYEPKHPEVLRINPKGQVPVLVDGMVEIFDSTQIFEYLEHRWPAPPLWPAEVAARAAARLLELKSDEVLFPLVGGLWRFVGKVDHPEQAAALAAIERCFAVLNRLLEDREYLAGAYSYADIALYMTLYFADSLGGAWVPTCRTLWHGARGCWTVRRCPGQYGHGPQPGAVSDPSARFSLRSSVH